MHRLNPAQCKNLRTLRSAVNAWCIAILIALSTALGTVATAEAAPADVVPCGSLTLSAASTTTLIQNIAISTGPASISAQDNSQKNPSFALRVGIGDMTPPVQAGEALNIPLALPTLSSTTIYEFDDTSQTPICQYRLVLVSLPTSWSTSETQIGDDEIKIHARRPSDEFGPADVLYTFKAGSLLHFDATIGNPQVGTHLELSEGGSLKDISRFAVNAKLVNALGMEALSNTPQPSLNPVKQGSPASCPGFPEILDQTPRTSTVTLPPFQLTQGSITFDCGPAELALSAALAATDHWKQTINLIAHYHNDATGGSANIDAADGSNPAISIGKTQFAITSVNYAGGSWSFASNVTFQNLASDPSSEASLAIKSDGTVVLASPAELRLGSVNVRLSALSCSKTCSGVLGIELPGFDPFSTSDSPLLVSFSNDSSRITFPATTLRSKVSGFTFSITPEANSFISKDKIVLQGSGYVEIPNVSRATIKSLSFKASRPGDAHNPSSLDITGDVSLPTGVKYSLFDLTNLTGHLAYHSAIDSSMTLTLDGDGEIGSDVFSNSRDIQLEGSARNMKVLFTIGKATTFQVDPAAITFKGFFFGRRIDGGCNNLGKTLFFTSDNSTYELCLGVHLTPGLSGQDDIVDADLHLSRDDQNAKLGLRSAELSYDSTTAKRTTTGTSEQTRTTTKLVDKSTVEHVERSTSETTSESPNPAQNGTPLKLMLGGKTIDITRFKVAYATDDKNNPVVGMDAPGWAHSCPDSLYGSLTFDAQSVVNSKTTLPVEMTASVGFGQIAVAGTVASDGTEERHPCFWFDADGTAGIQIAPNVSAVIYHAEFATYQDSKDQVRPAVHLEATGDIAFQNYTVAFKSISFDDTGLQGAKLQSHIDVDKPNTLLKNVPAIASFVGALAARLLVK